MTTLLQLLLPALLAGLAILFYWLHRRQSRRITAAEDKKDAILAEERRLFDFLHELGESLSLDSNRGAIHRLIVEGAQRVTDSGGGALYLLDEESKDLVPKFYSAECPPLVRVPERIIAQARQNPSSLLSFLRLHAVDKHSGVIGSVFASQQAEMISNLKRDERFGSSNNPLHLPTGAMLCPLSCGGRHLGVLAVANPRDRSRFDENDFEVFRSLAEQSAFALSNSLIRQEAKAKH